MLILKQGSMVQTKTLLLTPALQLVVDTQSPPLPLTSRTEENTTWAPMPLTITPMPLTLSLSSSLMLHSQLISSHHSSTW